MSSHALRYTFTFTTIYRYIIINRKRDVVFLCYRIHLWSKFLNGDLGTGEVCFCGGKVNFLSQNTNCYQFRYEGVSCIILASFWKLVSPQWTCRETEKAKIELLCWFIVGNVCHTLYARKTPAFAFELLTIYLPNTLLRFIRSRKKYTYKITKIACVWGDKFHVCVHREKLNLSFWRKPSFCRRHINWN